MTGKNSQKTKSQFKGLKKAGQRMKKEFNAMRAVGKGRLKQFFHDGVSAKTSSNAATSNQSKHISTHKVDGEQLHSLARIKAHPVLLATDHSLDSNKATQNGNDYSESRQNKPKDKDIPDHYSATNTLRVINSDSTFSPTVSGDSHNTAVFTSDSSVSTAATLDDRISDDFDEVAANRNEEPKSRHKKKMIRKSGHSSRSRRPFQVANVINMVRTMLSPLNQKINRNTNGRQQTSDSQGGSNMSYQEELQLVFGTVLEITDKQLVSLARKYFPEKGNQISVHPGRLEGSYNRVHIIQLFDGSKYIIRVPACAGTGEWNAHDVYAMRSQVHTMEFISRESSLPVPTIIGYDVTSQNEIGHPYMIMNFMEGHRVCDVWDGCAFTPELEETRVKILKSIAHTMTELQNMVFDSAGMLTLKDGIPSVGKIYNCYEGEPGSRLYGVIHQTSLEPRYISSHARLVEKLNNWKKVITDLRGPQGERQTEARVKLWRIIIDSLPFAPPHISRSRMNEGFVLAPPDFNWQNILVNDDCEVVGILDWDVASTVPRYIGWAATPRWLAQDYTREYEWMGIGNTPRDLQRYRRHYASFMAAAMAGEGDAVFTHKSHLYAAVWDAMEKPRGSDIILRKLLSLVMPHVDHAAFIDDIAEYGFFSNQEWWLRAEFAELFDIQAEDPDFNYPV